MRNESVISRNREKYWQRKGAAQMAGVDEAGRGPWAGPVVACAVILPGDFPIELLDDSKKLTPIRRRKAYDRLRGHPGVLSSLGEASVEEIDRLNILRATFLAMERALGGLSVRPDAVLVDGRDFPFFMTVGEAIIGGDAQVASIAAASILAKESRDDLMVELAREYPDYGFETHKGYGTREHQEALTRLGPCPIHRRSFAPIRELLKNKKAQLHSK